MSVSRGRLKTCSAGAPGMASERSSTLLVASLCATEMKLPYDDHRDLSRAMYATDQNQLDIGSAARPRDQHHRTGLRRWIRQNGEQLVQSGKDALAGEHRQVRGRQ